jgi:hypothetical protein
MSFSLNTWQSLLCKIAFAVQQATPTCSGFKTLYCHMVLWVRSPSVMQPSVGQACI